MRRVAPAIALFFVAPLVAEFLLGNLPISLLPALIVLAPMYGGGALLVREVVRRTGRGWPSIFVLGLAYGIFEEAFTTQSLFNPDYLKLGMHLLQPAYVPALGIGAWWTCFVLTLHTVWSVATSIALVEALVPARATTAWLGRAGLAIVAVLFTIGAVATTRFTLARDPYVAPAPQLVASAVVTIALVVLALALPRGSSARRDDRVPSPWLIGGGALVAGSAFFVTPKAWGWGAVAIYAVLYLLVVFLVREWSSRADWDDRHRLALGAGAALTYAWHAFPQHPVIADPRTDIIGNIVFALAAVAVIAIAARRLRLH